MTDFDIVLAGSQLQFKMIDDGVTDIRNSVFFIYYLHTLFFKYYVIEIRNVDHRIYVIKVAIIVIR